MQFMMILAVALAFAMVQRRIAVRVWGIPEFAHGFLGDASVHFAIIRHLARSPRSRFIDNYLISPEPMSYPTAFHHFCRLFAEKTLRSKPWLPNFVLHLLGVGFIGAVAWGISGGSPVATSLALAIYLLAPSLWIFTGPGIAYLGLSERFFARLTCSAGYLGLAVGCVLDSDGLMAVGIVFATLAVLGSVFARQALFFSGPLLSALLLDVRPLLLVVVAVGLALLVGRRHMWDGLRHTVLQWRMYRTHTKKSPLVRKALLGFFKWQLNCKGGFLRNIAINLWEKEPTRIFFWYPELLLAVLLLSMSSGNYAAGLALTLLPPFVLYLLTLFERFNHLGEAYRYLEYNLSFLLPILVVLVYDGSPVQTVLLAVYAVVAAGLVMVRYSIRSRQLRGQGVPEDEISKFITQTGITGPAIVFPVSMRLGADLVARREDWKSFWWQPGIISESIYIEYVEEYPFLKRDWRTLAESHGVTHIICDKRHDTQLKSWQYDFSALEKITENENFVAYSVHSAGWRRTP